MQMQCTARSSPSTQRHSLCRQHSGRVQLDAALSLPLPLFGARHPWRQPVPPLCASLSLPLPTPLSRRGLVVRSQRGVGGRNVRGRTITGRRCNSQVRCAQASCQAVIEERGQGNEGGGHDRNTKDNHLSNPMGCTHPHLTHLSLQTNPHSTGKMATDANLTALHPELAPSTSIDRRVTEQPNRAHVPVPLFPLQCIVFTYLQDQTVCEDQRLSPLLHLPACLPLLPLLLHPHVHRHFPH